MSKAFTKEDDREGDDDGPGLFRSSPPPGVKNYMTADGAERLRRQLEHLVQAVRPVVAADATGNEEARQRLRSVDRRIRLLSESLETAEIVQPDKTAPERVRFGNTVTVRGEDGGEAVYRLVGVDETEEERGWISWRSPLARALLNARAGDRVKFRLPETEQKLLVLRIDP